MIVEILNLYNNEIELNSDLKADHGQSFLISAGNKKILFDAGACSEILLYNMEQLNVNPNSITDIVLSHGHNDHTGGLPGLLDKIDHKEKIPVYAHPDFNQDKILKVADIELSLGCPRLTDEQMKKIDLKLSTCSQHITPYLRTSGEVVERPELDGVDPVLFYRENDLLIRDRLMDDLSLILSTPTGEVLILGCAHSGLLNICSHVQKMLKRPITTIIGGTHMALYSDEEVLHVADELEESYQSPNLYLNHCTDQLDIPDHIQLPIPVNSQVVNLVASRLGENKVSKCKVGSIITIQI